MTRATSPSIIALAGPNGAGKSTAGPSLIRKVLGVTEYVDADVIARRLPGRTSTRAAFAAGRIMLRTMRALAAKRQSFAFETTLSARSYAPWIRELKSAGYRFHVVFLWLPSTELAIKRVADRVRRGGHGVSTEPQGEA